MDKGADGLSSSFLSAAADILAMRQARKIAVIVVSEMRPKKGASFL